MRTSGITRNTNETKISVSINLDGSGKSGIETGCGFLDHMLTLFAKHAKFDLYVDCDGDTFIDDHHSVEDVGITLGRAFSDALGDRRGIVRYADSIIPMDEALMLCAVDISGRGFLSFDIDFPTDKIGTFDTELVEEFFIAFARNANLTLHLKMLSGANSHHIAEGAFKAFARTMRTAAAYDEEFRHEIPSTKGVL